MGAEQEAWAEERDAKGRAENPRAYERRDPITGLKIPEPAPGQPGGRMPHDLEEK